MFKHNIQMLTAAAEKKLRLLVVAVAVVVVENERSAIMANMLTFPSEEEHFVSLNICPPSNKC